MPKETDEGLLRDLDAALRTGHAFNILREVDALLRRQGMLQQVEASAARGGAVKAPELPSAAEYSAAVLELARIYRDGGLPPVVFSPPEAYEATFARRRKLRALLSRVAASLSDFLPNDRLPDSFLSFRPALPSVRVNEDLLVRAIVEAWRYAWPLTHKGPAPTTTSPVPDRNVATVLQRHDDRARTTRPPAGFRGSPISTGEAYKRWIRMKVPLDEKNMCERSFRQKVKSRALPFDRWIEGRDWCVTPGRHLRVSADSLADLIADRETHTANVQAGMKCLDQARRVGIQVQS